MSKWHCGRSCAPIASAAAAGAADGEESAESGRGGAGPLGRGAAEGREGEHPPARAGLPHSRGAPHLVAQLRVSAGERPASAAGAQRHQRNATSSRPGPLQGSRDWQRVSQESNLAEGLAPVLQPAPCPAPQDQRSNPECADVCEHREISWSRARKRRRCEVETSAAYVALRAVASGFCSPRSRWLSRVKRLTETRCASLTLASLRQEAGPTAQLQHVGGESRRPTSWRSS